jgi:hypothetical protein
MWPAINILVDIIETQLDCMVPGSHPGQDGKNSAYMTKKGTRIRTFSNSFISY